jgi:hypothetical protein
MHVTGALALGDAVFLPEAVRIAKVAGDRVAVPSL